MIFGRKKGFVETGIKNRDASRILDESFEG